MNLLDEQLVNQVTEMMSGLPNTVRLVVFTTQTGCEYCKEIAQLAQEVAATSDKLTAEVYDIAAEPQKAKALNITEAPVVAILGERDYGLRFYGIPSGHEFESLLYSIHSASFGDATDLDAETKTYLQSLNKPVDIQVFVTPTCPYCKTSAKLAYAMAVTSDMVTANVVESMEFPDRANRYNVMGVPLNVINDKERVEGAAPPHMMVSAIKNALA